MADAIRVLTFGDSITAGLGYRRAIVDAAERRGLSLVLVGRQVDGHGLRHDGIVGRTATAGAADLPEALATSKADVVLVLLGANFDAGGLLSYRAAMRRIVAIAARFGASVIVGSVTPQPAHQETIDAENAILLELIDEIGGPRVRLADLSAVGPEDLIDGVHLDADGVRKVGEGWGESLYRWHDRSGRILRAVAAMSLAAALSIGAVLRSRGWHLPRWPWGRR